MGIVRERRYWREKKLGGKKGEGEKGEKLIQEGTGVKKMEEG